MPTPQEVVIALAALGGLALPALARIEQRRARAAATAATLLLLGLGGWAGLRPSRARPAPPAALAPAVERRDAWVGSAACRACHPGEHASWHASYHRTMTQTPSPGAVLGAFDGTVLTAPDGRVWTLARAGDAFTASVGGVTSSLALVTGSHHMQVAWVPSGKPRLLEQVPFVWLVDERRWVPRNAAFLRPPEVGRAPPSELGRWNLVCLRCHTADPRSRPLGRLDAFDTRVGELGIACESCHGPGAEHAAANRDPARRYALHLGDAPDPTIVNPARLDPLRAAQVCGQCHSVNCEQSEEAWRRWTEEGFAYRAGDDLLASRAVVHAPLRPDVDPLAATIARMDPHFEEDRFWNDGQIRIGGRELNGLLRSPCFQGGELSCTTCHAMHREDGDPRPAREWANDQLRPSAVGDAECARCHGAVAEAGPAHTHHRAGSSGGECMNCHMPHTTYGLLKAIRSHEVTSPDVALDLRGGRPNACNLCHLDRTLAWTAERLQAWYGTPAPELDDDAREVATGPRWLLTGDAGQRALAAWATAWPPARAAAGADWLPPYLARLATDDPYDAVRILAWRSLRTLPEAGGVALDPIAPREARAASAEAVLGRWRPTRDVPGALVREGRLDAARFEALFLRRDDRRVDLIE